jgi:serine/threonine-protein kinase
MAQLDGHGAISREKSRFRTRARLLLSSVELKTRNQTTVPAYRSRPGDAGTHQRFKRQRIMPCQELPIGIAAGDTLLGKYRVERVLGVGGMGAVVAARHLKLDQTVAIKVLLPEVGEDPDMVTRFEREARAAAKIKSDHIVRVNDVGALDDGTPYMVMEHLEGEDLEKYLKRRRSLPIDRAVEIAVQVCEVLSEAHALGIVHRDLKPANLFCVPRADGTPSIKVLDFGISKMMSENLTNARGVMGSPAYMSPEQIRAPHEVDGRADIWALGIVLYEMLTGFAPFTARTLPAILTNIATCPAPSVRRYRLDVPAKLEAVIQKCLEKDPDNRYASAAEVADALAPFVRKEIERTSSPPPSSRSLPVVFTASRAERVSESGAATGWLAAAAAVLLVLVGVLGTLPRASHASAFSRAASNGAASPPIARACASSAPVASASKPASPVCEEAMTERECLGAERKR